MKTFIVCISLFSCFFAQANVATHSPQSCQQVQIRVFAPESQQVQFGNGFAVQDNKVVANDHLFGRGDGRIRITLEGAVGEPVEYSARLIKRDFHTDLALLVLPEADLRNHGMFPLASCLPYFAKGPVPNELNLIGWQEGESQKKEIPVTLRDPSANDFAIPGVESGYHFQEKNAMRVSKGRSGSLFWSNHEIHGMLFQKNSENFLL
ncbi:MAG TPA: hypothetical protein PLU50_03720, partial [Pseudobdellovibrionaceae bacterium]|nr:hypothetical protein [Pseudobdellovibrionaceae bacterium]